MDNINNWNEELTIGTAISNIIDLEKRYFILKDRIDKAIEYIEDSFENEYGMSKKELKTYNLKNCTYDASLVVLGILRGDNNE